jgi:hypothetical protein
MCLRSQLELEIERTYIAIAYPHQINKHISTAAATAIEGILPSWFKLTEHNNNNNTRTVTDY